MAHAPEIHSLPTSSQLPVSPSSTLKNSFKSVFRQALAGPVSITRNRKAEAILLPVELYDRMIAELAARDPLNTLREEYERRFGALQSDAARAALDAAFDADPDTLGQAAVAGAADPP